MKLLAENALLFKIMKSVGIMKNVKTDSSAIQIPMNVNVFEERGCFAQKELNTVKTVTFVEQLMQQQQQVV